MSFFESFSGRKLLVAAFSIATLSLLPATAAYADQFNYVFSGYADGTNQTLSIPFSDIPFTLTFSSLDTSTIDNRGGGYYSYDDVNATLVAGGGTFMLTNVTLEVNGTSGFQNVDFYDSTGTNGLGFSMVTPVGYNLTTNLNVASTSSNLTPTVPPSWNGTFTATNGNVLQFTGNESLAFTATDLTPAATPEPSSLLLLASGLPGLALLRRRFLKA